VPVARKHYIRSYREILRTSTCSSCFRAFGANPNPEILHEAGHARFRHRALSLSGHGSARVKWLLHKLVGDEFKVNRIDLYSLEAHGPDYLRLNPNHNVPLIRFRMGDGEPVTAVESGAILTLLGGCS
jgi:hypothetical protein